MSVLSKCPDRAAKLPGAAQRLAVHDERVHHPAVCANCVQRFSPVAHVRVDVIPIGSSGRFAPTSFGLTHSRRSHLAQARRSCPPLRRRALNQNSARDCGGLLPRQPLEDLLVPSRGPVLGVALAADRTCLPNGPAAQQVRQGSTPASSALCQNRCGSFGFGF